MFNPIIVCTFLQRWKYLQNMLFSYCPTCKDNNAACRLCYAAAHRQDPVCAPSHHQAAVGRGPSGSQPTRLHLHCSSAQAGWVGLRKRQVLELEFLLHFYFHLIMMMIMTMMCAELCPPCFSLCLLSFSSLSSLSLSSFSHFFLSFLSFSFNIKSSISFLIFKSWGYQVIWLMT